MSRIIRVSNGFYDELRRLRNELKKQGKPLTDPQITDIIAYRLKKKKKPRSVADLLFG